MKDLNSEQNWIYDLIESSDQNTPDIDKISIASSSMTEERKRELRSVSAGVCRCRACRVSRRERKDHIDDDRHVSSELGELNFSVGLNCILISPVSQDRLLIKKLAELQDFALIPRLNYGEMLSVMQESDLSFLSTHDCTFFNNRSQIYVSEGSWTCKLSEASMSAVSSLSALLSCEAAISRHRDTLWIFDMPDIAVHRSRLKDFSMKLSQLAMKHSSRLIVTTQNPELLAHAENQYVISVTKIKALNRKITP